MLILEIPNCFLYLVLEFCTTCCHQNHFRTMAQRFTGPKIATKWENLTLDLEISVRQRDPTYFSLEFG